MNKGHVVLPKSVTPSRIEENLKIIKLDESDMAALESIHKKKGLTRFVYPPFGVSISCPVPDARILTLLASSGQSGLSGQAMILFAAI